MASPKKLDYQAAQKRIEDERIYQESKRQPLPWLTISHDGQELLIDLLREVLRIEVAKVLGEIFNGFTVGSTGDNTLDGRIEKYLLNRKYKNNAFKWNRQTDIELMLGSLKVLGSGKTLGSFQRIFAEEKGFTHRAVEQRWGKLVAELKEEGIDI